VCSPIPRSMNDGSGSERDRPARGRHQKIVCRRRIVPIHIQRHDQVLYVGTKSVIQHLDLWDPCILDAQYLHVDGGAESFSGDLSSVLG